MIRIKKKKRNPHLNDIKNYIKNNSINFHEIGMGSEGRAYYFKLNSRLVLNQHLLQKGEYVLKITFPHAEYSDSELKKLKIISKYGLIPEIYVFNSKYLIMKHIKGENFYILYPKLTNKEVLMIRDKVDKLAAVWKKLGLNKFRDTNDENILVTQDLRKVYLIDPIVNDELDDDNEKIYD